MLFVCSNEKPKTILLTFASLFAPAILVLYLSRKLHYDEITSIYLFHIFSSLVYFFPLFGAMIADSWLGKYRTINYLSIVYALGGILIAVGAIPTLNLPVKFMTVVGLGLIAFGTGGIKPCVSAFGGDQFKLPDQAHHLVTFFSLFYCAINAGSLISTILTPILRENVHCFGDRDCYSLAFGVPAVLMVVSILIFVLGKRLYVIRKPSGKMGKIFKCIGNALFLKISVGSANPQRHWLDYAEPKYGRKLVSDVKILLKILVLYIPLPMFWALFDQQGSRWTFQATRLNPRVFGFIIQPDQLQLLNPLLIILLVPLFNTSIYPCLKKCRITRPLQKLVIGGLLVTVSFLIAGWIENIQYNEDLQNAFPTPKTSKVVLINAYPCDFKFKPAFESEHLIPKYSKFTKTLQEGEKLTITWTPMKTEKNPVCRTIWKTIENVTLGNWNTFIIRPKNEKNLAEYEVEKLDIVYARGRNFVPDISVVLANGSWTGELELDHSDMTQVIKFDLLKNRSILNFEIPEQDHYMFLVKNRSIAKDVELKFGEKSLLILGENENNKPVRK